MFLHIVTWQTQGLSDIIYVLNHLHFTRSGRAKGDNIFLILNQGEKLLKYKKKVVK